MGSRNKLPIYFFHLSREAAENNLLDFFRRIVPDRFHGDIGGSFPRVAIDACRNSGEGDRLASIFFGQVEATSVAGFQKFRFAMLAILINRTRSMNHKLCRESETWGNFSLASFATVQGNAGLQELRACRTMNCPVDSAATQKRTIRRIHNGIDFQFGNIALDNFNFNHNNLQKKYT